MPLVSEDWRQVSDWNGEGAPPAGLRSSLEDLAGQAEAQGRRLRFWGSPDGPSAWRLLHEAGVDLINTDDLEGLHEFLSEAEEAG